MTVTSLKKFNAAIRGAGKSDSAAGAKLTKSEVTKALKELSADGKVTPTETKAAKDLLAKGKLTAGAEEALKAFVAQNETAGPDAKLSSDKVATLTAKVNTLVRRSNVEWHTSMPLGARFHREELFRERHPDGFSYGVMVKTGALTPTAPQVDPNKATEFWVVRSGGLAGRTTYAGPFDMPKSTRGGVNTIINSRTGGSDSGGAAPVHVGGSDSGGGRPS